MKKVINMVLGFLLLFLDLILCSELLILIMGMNGVYTLTIVFFIFLLIITILVAKSLLEV